jgi:hypothetical protein
MWVFGCACRRAWGDVGRSRRLGKPKDDADGLEGRRDFASLRLLFFLFIYLPCSIEQPAVWSYIVMMLDSDSTRIKSGSKACIDKDKSELRTRGLAHYD